MFLGLICEHYFLPDGTNAMESWDFLIAGHKALCWKHASMWYDLIPSPEIQSACTSGYNDILNTGHTTICFNVQVCPMLTVLSAEGGAKEKRFKRQQGKKLYSQHIRFVNLFNQTTLIFSFTFFSKSFDNNCCLTSPEVSSKKAKQSLGLHIAKCKNLIKMCFQPPLWIIKCTFLYTIEWLMAFHSLVCTCPFYCSSRQDLGRHYSWHSQVVGDYLLR